MVSTESTLSLEKLLANLKPEPSTGSLSETDSAIAIAAQLLERSRELQTAEEAAQQAELNRMISLSDDKATLVAMTDQAFRTQTAARVADQLTHILDLQGVPRFFSPLDRTMLRGFQSFGSYLPGVIVPLVKDKMRRETANVILPAEPELLVEHLKARQKDGVRMNVNFLGEALLGETEAISRLNKYLRALATPEIECISVKISTIYSQISPLAYRNTIGVVADRMELLYRAAIRNSFTRADGSMTSKFVYLDMEEYRDMNLTAEVLMNTLDRPGMREARAGIALQAYVPDSYGVLERLVDWSKKRVARGGAPLTVRVVKGANMEMEKVEASVSGWPQAPYSDKRDTDANYKKMLKLLLDPKTANAVQTGVASHNLFDLSTALLWAQKNRVLESVQFEMLEGMANHQRRALFEATGEMLLYAPACSQKDFLNAIGYLIRRLDENTGPENFLRHTFNLKTGSEEWMHLIDGYLDSFSRIDSVSSSPRRTQDRNQQPTQPRISSDWKAFENEPDTDWSLLHNAQWGERLLEKWNARCNDQATRIPLHVGKHQIASETRKTRESFDPSRSAVVSCRFAEANASDLRSSVQIAHDDPSGWRRTSIDHRRQLLRSSAHLMRQRRDDLIGAAVSDAGKTVMEADPEVSEAIDFAEFYPVTVQPFSQWSRPVGVVAVISPWNFPLAIPCGGVAAALAAGNTVILKPASDAVLPAFEICKCFWDAGVPREALQLMPCRGSDAGKHLVSNPSVDCVILTGGTSTAKSMLRSRPGLDLLAETGGKNATIVTALSDRELAIKHVLHSAFGHSGQKCSATSLLLLEEEVYEDERFRDTLIDAVESLRVGSAWDPSTKIGPLIRPPTDELARGMKELEPGESWAVMPEKVDGNPCLYRPGVKWNVRPGSFTHCTELFGPVLGVMPYRRLEDAIGIVNATGYGLTSGLESLDGREQEIWRESIMAGNLYINRPTTGAIVLRQPFGGMGASAYGAGLKAGGPNYVAGLMKHAEPSTNSAKNLSGDQKIGSPRSNEDTGLLDDLFRQLVESVTKLSAKDPAFDVGKASLVGALDSIRSATDQEFSRVHDNMKLTGQDNLRRYLPVHHQRIRLQPSDTVLSTLITAAAAVAANCRPVFSHLSVGNQHCLEALRVLQEVWHGRLEILEETETELAAAILKKEVDRVRILSNESLEQDVLKACAEAFVPIIQHPVALDGRVEVLWYVREQSISHDYHRYGNLGNRDISAVKTNESTS